MEEYSGITRSWRSIHPSRRLRMSCESAMSCSAPRRYPRTNARLSAVATVRIVDVSELAKAEGALTCCSLIFKR